MLTCTGIDNYLAKDKGNCPNKYESIPDVYGNTICQFIEARASIGFTSRVTDFKRYNKCKIKY